MHSVAKGVIGTAAVSALGAHIGAALTVIAVAIGLFAIVWGALFLVSLFVPQRQHALAVLDRAIDFVSVLRHASTSGTSLRRAARGAGESLTRPTQPPAGGSGRR